MGWDGRESKGEGRVKEIETEGRGGRKDRRLGVWIGYGRDADRDGRQDDSNRGEEEEDEGGIVGRVVGG